jgi:hypothetical protein
VGNVYRGTFAPDERTFFFFKKMTGDEEDYRIFSSRNVNGSWSEPEQVNLGGKFSDLYPTISRDGRRMVFSSYRPVDGDTSPSRSSSPRNANLWYVDRVGDGWGAPVFIANASTPANYDAKPFFGRDGEIYFESTTPDWSTTQSLVTRWDGEVYGTPEVFEAVERWRSWRTDLFVWGGVPTQDGRSIILDISQRDAETGRASASDQWISTRNKDGSWTEPVLLGLGLNSDGYDNFSFFSADGEKLFFVRDFSRFYSISLAAVDRFLQVPR